jgi:hypothetical protein
MNYEVITNTIKLTQVSNIYTYILTLMLLIFFHYQGSAQTARFLIINNNSAAGAAKLDMEVRVADTVYFRVNGIAVHNASVPVTVPASVPLKITLLQAGSQVAFYTYKNAIFPSKDFKVLFLYGTADAIAFSIIQAYDKALLPGRLKYDIRHSTPGLGEIDVAIRQTLYRIADNFVYGEGSSWHQEISAMNYKLDIMPYDSTYRLFSYDFPGASLVGQFVVLFTAGTATANDMYVAEMNGKVSRLNMLPLSVRAPADKGPATVNMFPVPASVLLKFELTENSGKTEIEIHDLQGKVLIRQTVNGLNTEIDISGIAKGMYLAKIGSEAGVIVKRFMKE